jgi:hypothetical protein
MKRLLFLLLLPVLAYSQKDIERYKIYPTENIYTVLKLDTATGKIWQLQMALGDVSPLVTVLGDEIAPFKEALIQYQKSIIENWEEEHPNPTPEELELKPESVEEFISSEFWEFAQNGRYKLYPTQNTYNFIMQDVISGKSYQVQWNTDENYRFVRLFY